MNTLFKKIIAGFCAISITISCIVPVSATNQTEVTSEFGTFWEQYLKWQYDIADIWGDNIGGFCKLVAVGLSADLCGKSDDSKHHGYIIGPAVTLFGETKYPAKCNLCGQGFSVTDAQISDAYTEAVNQMPASGYNSAGKLLWQPKWSDFKGALNSFSNYSDDGGYVFTGRSFPINYTSSKFDTAFVSDGTSLSVSLGSNVAKRTSLRLWLSNGTLDVPISGNYFLLASDFIDGSYYSQNTSSLVVTPCLFSKDYSSQTIGYLAGGSSYKLPYSSFFPLAYVNSAPTIFNSSAFISGVYLHSGSFTVRTPVFAIEPISDTPTINNTYNINTRVNNFQGNYYNNVTNNYYNNTTIINETTNNYYDMTTNNYYTMSNWSYDYQSRTYFVTLEDGTTITVQFGDDCLTITNNNVENSYQYVINNNNTPSPNPETPSTCKHNWTETIDVAPTCLEGGHANFTCSLCGETYEQILSAKGHNWTVKEHVNTVYGENGVIVTQGHTLYECSACGEQWYTETATPPPDVSGGSNILAWLQEFKTWLGDKLDNLFQGDGDTNNFWNTNKKSFTDVLSSLLQTLLDFLTDILEKLLGLVKDLLSFLFDLISSVVITGISDFFTGLKDSRLFDFVVKDDEGSVTALPEGVATVFAFFSGVILALPVELRSILLFGTAIIVLIGVIKIIKS